MGGQIAQEWVEQLRELHEASYAWALTCCNFSPDDAADVLQATYVKIYSGKAKFEGRSMLKTWLFSVIRNTARERFRKSRSRSSLLSTWWKGAEPLQDTVATPQEELEISQQQTSIRNALNELPDRQREVVELVFYQDLTLQQAAEVMGVHIGTAKSHYDRAKQYLERRLRPELECA